MQMVREFQRIYSACIGLFISILLVGCAGPRLVSHTAEDDIRIDGEQTEWTNELQYQEDAGVSLGIAHDKQSIYFCIVVADPEVKRVTYLRGLTLWLDAGGGRDKAFGIKYPLGLTPALRQELLRQQDQWTGIPNYQRILDRLPADFLLLRRGQEDTPMSVEDNPANIRLGLNLDHGNLVYEGKIPLTEIFHSPAGVPTSGAKVGLGIENPQPESNRQMEARQVPQQGGPMGSPTTGRRRGSARLDQQSPTRQSGLDLWRTIQIPPAES